MQVHDLIFTGALGRVAQASQDAEWGLWHGMELNRVYVGHVLVGLRQLVPSGISWGNGSCRQQVLLDISHIKGWYHVHVLHPTSQSVDKQGCQGLVHHQLLR